jgi:hypothetical protein
MTASEYLDVLDQRRRYLEQRVQAKKTVGWDYAYDQRERDALAFVLGVLTEPQEPAADGSCQHPDDKRTDYSTFTVNQFFCAACKTMVKA